jgi:SHS2 domain-containing protein
VTEADARRAYWEHFPHGADIGIHGAGATKSEAFRQAALALTAVVTTVPVRPLERVELACSAPDDDLLLLAWLNLIVYEMATRRMLFGEYEVTVQNGQAAGAAFGELVDPQRHEPAVEVKGATCTALSVRQEGSTWHARCVVDV